MTEKSSQTPMIVLGLLFLVLGVGVYILLKAIMPSDGNFLQRTPLRVGPPLPLSAYKPGPPKLRKLGRELYLQHCQLCHGPQGKGDGPGARNLEPRPTPYVWGTFRYGNQYEDILRTITKGSPNRRSGMIAWNWLPIIQRKALAHYVLALSVSNAPQAPIQPKNKTTSSQTATPKAAAPKGQVPKGQVPKGQVPKAAAPTNRQAVPAPVAPMDRTRISPVRQ